MVLTCCSWVAVSGALQKCAPTTEEIDAVRNFDGDVEMLGNCEKFFLAMADIPNLARRLELHIFKQNFTTICSELEGSMSLVEQASSVLRNSTNLKTVLEIVLALGNYLNGGTRQGAAYGFKPATLEKVGKCHSRLVARHLTTLLCCTDSCVAPKPLTTR